MVGAPGRDENGRGRGREIQSSRPLHNFTLPSQLKWGNQKQLRCFKSSPPSHPHPNPVNSAPSSDQRRQQGSRLKKDKSPIPYSGGDANEIEVVRQKLISDLKIEAGQFKLPIIHNEDNKNKMNAAAGEKKSSEEELPWNLRTRRAAAAGKAMNDYGNAGSSPLKRQDKGLKCFAPVTAVDKGKARRVSEQAPPSLKPKFSLTLSKEEIEADFILMTGAKPLKRPKKRAKNVRKQLNVLVPGCWLTEVIPENYKVYDTNEPKGEK